jgi:tRNA(fMet)-specific endonuclease VapC
MLDTNICSYILRCRPQKVKEHFDRIGPDSIAISSVVLAELYFGAISHPQAKGLLRQIEDFRSRLDVISWDDDAAMHYGEIRACLQKAGKPIGNMDLMIAAHARSLGATLVTNNLREFERVDGLTTENWA